MRIQVRRSLLKTTVNGKLYLKKMFTHVSPEVCDATKEQYLICSRAPKNTTITVFANFELQHVSLAQVFFF